MSQHSFDIRENMQMALPFCQERDGTIAINRSRQNTVAGYLNAVLILLSETVTLTWSPVPCFFQVSADAHEEQFFKYKQARRFSSLLVSAALRNHESEINW